LEKVCLSKALNTRKLYKQNVGKISLGTGLIAGVAIVGALWYASSKFEEATRPVEAVIDTGKAALSWSAPAVLSNLATMAATTVQGIFQSVVDAPIPSIPSQPISLPPIIAASVLLDQYYVGTQGEYEANYFLLKVSVTNEGNVAQSFGVGLSYQVGSSGWTDVWMYELKKVFVQPGQTVVLYEKFDRNLIVSSTPSIWVTVRDLQAPKESNTLAEAKFDWYLNMAERFEGI
jgi:hypothetical protein